jgi:hypothetical protein
MGTARSEPTRRHEPRPAPRLARVVIVLLLAVAVVAVLVALTLGAADPRTERAPWARPGAPDLRPQPIDEQ